MLCDSPPAFHHQTNTHFPVLKLMSGETTGTHLMPVVLKSSRTVTGCNSSAPEQTDWSCSRGAVRGGRELTGIVRKLSERPADGDELVSDGFIEKAAGTNSLSQHGSTTHTHTHSKYIDIDGLISHSASKSLFYLSFLQALNTFSRRKSRDRQRNNYKKSHVNIDRRTMV